MNDLELTWLVPTALQVLGLAIALSVVGFGYESAMRERKAFLGALEEGHRVRWLALAGVMFASGMGVTRAGWELKIIAIMLAGLLIGLAVTGSRAVRVEEKKAKRLKPTIKSVGKLLVKIYLGVFLVLILAWGINLGWHIVNLYRIANDLQGNSSQVNINNLTPTIIEAAGDITAIHQELSPLFPVFNGLQVIPGIGPYLGQVDPLLTYADSLALAGKEVVTGLKPLINEMHIEQTDVTLPEQASQVLEAGQEHFVDAARAIEKANQMRNRIQIDLLPDSFRSQYIKLDERFPLLIAGVNLLQSAPQLLGAGEAQNYLLLAQNRDELRATGGFISGIGLMTIQDGSILHFDLGDSYKVDDFSKAYPTPPEALKRFMLADYWVTRDANWSPDFPTAAQEAQNLYTLSTGIQTQGVIAFNQLAVERVLAVIGPVQVPGTGEAITAENVEEYMRLAWSPAPEEGLSAEWWLHRKDFMQQLGNAILDVALKSSDQTKLTNLAKMIFNLLDQGQLLVYFNEPRAQKALGTVVWDGALHPGTDDFLYLVDSNVGFNKADSVVQRSLTYTVDLSDLNHPTGEVIMTYHHNGIGQVDCKQQISYGNGTYTDLQQRCYLDYWRVYVPGGSKLINSTAESVPADELLNGEGWPGQVESIPGEVNTHVFAGLLMLPIGKSSQFNITYSLPKGIVQAESANIYQYDLHVQVQPGLDKLPFQVQITLPQQGNPVNPSIDWEKVDTRSWRWEGILNKSSTFDFSFRINPQP